MADLNMPQKGGRRKVAAPRIDLTPMVDLGFLLITFFMFTTTLAQNKALELNMPAPQPVNEPPMAFPEEATMTLIPTAHHGLSYYEGALKDARQIKTTNLRDLRSVLQHKQQLVANLPAKFSANAHQLHVLIKPDDSSQYSDLVAIVDEMLINKIGQYAIVDITEEEARMVRR